MNIFADIRALVIRALTDLTEAGQLPGNLDFTAVAVEPPRDAAHGPSRGRPSPMPRLQVCGHRLPPARPRPQSAAASGIKAPAQESRGRNRSLAGLR